MTDTYSLRVQERYIYARDLPEVANINGIDNDDEVLIVNREPSVSKPSPNRISMTLFKEFLGVPHFLTDTMLETGSGIATLGVDAKIKPSQLPNDLARTSDLQDYVPITFLGAANGVASLNLQGVIPDEQIPPFITRDSELLAHTLRTDNPHALTPTQIGAVPISALGAVNGVATLDSSSKLLSSQLPAILNLAGYTIDTNTFGDGKLLSIDAGSNKIVGISPQAASGGGGGSVNTATNLGITGVGVFKDKLTDTLRFKKLNSSTNTITITDDTVNNLIQLAVNPSVININNFTNILSVDKGGTGSAIQNWVDLTNGQNIAGIKTFNSSPIVPNATTNNQAAAFGQITPSTVGASLAQWNASQLRGVNISSTLPTNGQTLRFNGSAWEPSSTSVSVPNATSSVRGIITLAGDLTGVADAPQLISTGVNAGTYNFPSSVTVDIKGRITQIVAGSGSSGSGGSSVGGAANSIGGKEIDSTTFGLGNYILYNPDTDKIEFGPAKLNLLDDIDQITIAESTLANNQLLAYDNTSRKFVNKRVAEIGLDPLEAQWNSAYIQGVRISNQVPTGDQVLKYNASSRQYEPSTVAGTTSLAGAVNIGNSGIGIFKQVNQSLIELKKVFANSNKITVVDDTSNNRISLDVVENNISLSALSGVLPVDKGGSGLSSTPANGQLLIGDGSGFNLSTLTAGAGVTITNNAGEIIIASSGGGGGTSAVSNVGGSGIGIYRDTTTSLNFKRIASLSSRLSVTDNTGNSTVDLDVIPAQIDINTLGGTSPLSLAKGGTGSTTKNFVDLTTSQSIAGDKSFSGKVTIDTSTLDGYMLDLKNGLEYGGIKLMSGSTAGVGSVYLDAYTYVSATGANNKRFSLGWSESNGFTFFDSLSGSLSLNADSNNQRVGIGTRTPGAKLQVSGGCIVTSSTSLVTSPGSGNLLVQGSIRSDGNTSVGGTLGVSGEVTFTGNINFNSPSSNLVNFGSNGLQSPTLNTRSIGTKLLLYPNVSTTETDFAIGMRPNSIWYGIPSNTNSTYHHAFMGGTSELCRISGSASGQGRLGINTTSPGTALQVFGGVSITTNANAVSAPDGNLEVAGRTSTGGLRFGYRFSSTSTTVTTTDTWVGLGPTTTDLILTLPNANGLQGSLFILSKVSSGVGNVVITPQSGQVIAANTTFTLNNTTPTIGITTDGNNWVRLF